MEDHNTHDFSPTSFPSPNPSFGLSSSFGFELQSIIQILMISPRDIIMFLIYKLAWGFL